MVKQNKSRGRSNRRRGPRASVAATQTPNGALRVRGEELLLNITGAQSAPQIARLQPGNSDMPMFDSYAKIFDRYRIEEVRFTYYPSVGTTVGGTVCMGVDFDPRTSPKDFNATMACVPKSLGSAYTRHVLNVPKRQLMSRALLYTYRDDEKDRPVEDSAALSLAVANNNSTANLALGFVMASYVAYFEGPYKGN